MLTAEEFTDLPFGDWAGERAAAGPAELVSPPVPLVIEPPPWAGQEGDPLLARSAVEELPDVLVTLKAADADAESWPDPTVPPERYEPLVRFTPPPARARTLYGLQSRRPAPLPQSRCGRRTT